MTGGFAARRRVIGPAFVVALAINADLFVTQDVTRVPMPMPQVVPQLASGGASGDLSGFAGAPVPPAMLARKKVAPVVMPARDLPGLRAAAEKRLQAAGARTPAFVRMRALAELGTPYARIARALDQARRRDDAGEVRKLLEGALVAADPDDLVTREKLLRMLADALAVGGQADGAKARAAEALATAKRIAQIELVELENHRATLEVLKKQGRDPVKDRQMFLAKLNDLKVRAPGAGREAEKKQQDELNAKIRAALGKTTADELREEIRKRMRSR